MNFKEKQRVWGCTLREEDYEERRALERLLLGRDADYAEDAWALRRYAELRRLGAEDCAAALGRSVDAVEARLRLTELPRDVLAGLRADGLGERYARALLRLRDPDDHRRCLALIREQQLGAGEAEALVSSLCPATRRLGAGALPLLLGPFERAAEALRRWGIPCRVARQDEEERLVLTVTVEKRRVPPPAAEKDEIFIKKCFTNE